MQHFQTCKYRNGNTKIRKRLTFDLFRHFLEFKEMEMLYLVFVRCDELFLSYSISFYYCDDTMVSSSILWMIDRLKLFNVLFSIYFNNSDISSNTPFLSFWIDRKVQRMYDFNISRKDSQKTTDRLNNVNIPFEYCLIHNSNERLKVFHFIPWRL